jgi:hypothetical protein
LNEATHDERARRVGKACEFFEVVVDLQGVGRPAARGTDQQGTLDGGLDFVKLSDRRDSSRGPT